MAALIKRVALFVAGGLALLTLFGVALLGAKAAAVLALAVLIVVVVLLV